MKIFVDSVNLEQIERALSHFDLQGITCNPSIIHK